MVTAPAGWVLRESWRLAKDPAGFFSRLADEFGSFVRFEMGKRKFHLLCDPVLIQELLITHGGETEKFPRLRRGKGLFGDGLLTSEEPLHMRQRRLMQPAFHKERIASYARVMVECAESACAQWRDGGVVDVSGSMNRLALAIVSRTLFSANTDAEAEVISESLDEILLMLNRLVLPPGEIRLMAPLPSTIRYKRAIQRLDRLIFRLIAERRAAGPGRGDLLDLLIGARDEQGGGGMDDEQLRDEVVTLFVAGHDTTANALTWTWHHLSREAEARARMEACIDAVLDRRPPRAGDLPALAVVERTVAEAMRLHPPVWILGCRPRSSFEIGGATMDGSSILLVCMAALHRRPELWPDPDRFDPARFLPETAASRHRYAYLPFGAGSRLCIGERFAWMEAVLCVASIARRWRLDCIDDAEPAPRALLTLRPRNGLRLRAMRRLAR